jgi:transposase
MSTARLVITALVVEGLPVSEVAARYGVHRSWVHRLKARYDAEGDVAFEPRSRRPLSSPTAVAAGTVELIVALRKRLAGQGLDAGPETIVWHLREHHGVTVSRASVSRHLKAQGLITPEPAKRPRSSYIRFQAVMPNECWQADFTHYRLTRRDGSAGADVEICPGSTTVPATPLPSPRTPGSPARSC